MDLSTATTSVALHVTGMAWKIAWGLVLGFGISAFIQAFVSREDIAAQLGEPSLRAVVLATGAGAASSSCSYAAAAMSKTLFQKGAHLVCATAFLFASTNLVIEIGLVIWMLLGWKFVVAELIGGVAMIAVMVPLLRFAAPTGPFEEARRRLQEDAADSGHDHGSADGSLPISKIATAEGLRAAAKYFAADWSMVGRDVAIGIAIAGSLAALVPSEWWSVLFLSPESGGRPGPWIAVENAVVGPLIAIASFVCSVGNIPLAAVLWTAGISFGGVIAFIFADLVTIPMVLVYRRYYGWKAAGTYAALLLLTMIVVALGVDALFVALDWVPHREASQVITERSYFAWDYTAALNAIFLPLGAVLFWIGRRERAAGH
jgi:uncharacterized membrane protein YraQ (UPF0718 family)